jgi:L-asparagine transporter-like permease
MIIATSMLAPIASWLETQFVSAFVDVALLVALLTAGTLIVRFLNRHLHESGGGESEEHSEAWHERHER